MNILSCVLSMMAFAVPTHVNYTAGLLLSDAWTEVIPVGVLRNGNCLFHAVASGMEANRGTRQKGRKAGASTEVSEELQT